MEVLIRKEAKEDFRAVYAINQEAFGQDDEAKLVDALRKSDAFIPQLSLVATIADEIVGHILFTKIKIIANDQNEFDSLALAPMAVKSGFQKQGIGGQLIKHGLSIATELGYQSVIVLGHEHYYPKFGFVAADKWNIKAPFDVPANVFMGIELIENGLKNVSGTVQYPKEFESV